METNARKNRLFLGVSLALFLISSLAWAAADTTNAKKKKKPATPAAAQADGSAEPDKILYDRAMADYKKGHYTEARLSFQTLINTYPDSEYLAKAKLGIADSFYKEGGTSNLTQSIETYKDFETFFPFLDEASYAQMQVAMAHYRMMEKADRDNSQAQFAEDEFQTFLLKYPNSPLVPKADQKLREVQEILADGDFRVAQFYYLKGPRSYRASLARLNEIIDRYPLYSESDKALWMAGNIYEKAERREVADKLYARIVQEYPNSKLVDDAKGKLKSAGVPVPQADPAALAREMEERKYPVQHPGILQRTLLSTIKSNPDVSAAAHSGQPNLQPPAESTSAVDILKPGSAPPGAIAGGGSGVGSGNSVAVETVPAGSDNTSAPANSGASSETAPADNSAPASEGSNSSLPAPMNSESTSAPPASEARAETAAPAPSTSESATPNPTTGSATVPGSAPAATGTSATGGGSTAQSTSATPGTSSEATAGSAATADPNTESTSKKKKKGIKKLIPF
ncbi:MAG TPA: outer membrane protein assembly factor BamD [Candidatus Acidoferrales bacterium]|nr:outer membrane protein assembly factor BamD [Candidatus Acidoferrales bacterium]